MQTIPVDLNLKRGTFRIAHPLYLGETVVLDFGDQGSYSLWLTEPFADNSKIPTKVWAQSDDGNRLALTRKALHDAFRKADALHPNMTLTAKAFVIDKNAVIADRGGTVADGEVTIEYTPQSYNIDTADYPTVQEILAKASAAKEICVIAQGDVSEKYTSVREWHSEVMNSRDFVEEKAGEIGHTKERIIAECKGYTDSATSELESKLRAEHRKDTARIDQNVSKNAQEIESVGASLASEVEVRGRKDEEHDNRIAELDEEIDTIKGDIEGLQENKADLEGRVIDGGVQKMLRRDQLPPEATDVVFCDSLDEIKSITDERDDVIYVDKSANILYRRIKVDYHKWEVIQVGGAGGGVEVYDWMDLLPAKGKEGVIYCVTEKDSYVTRLYRWSSDEAKYVQITYSRADVDSQIAENLEGYTTGVLDSRYIREVVPPSADGAGKAADAKAVHEELERRLNKYPFVNHNLMGEPNEGLNLTPYARTQIVMGGSDTFTVLGVLGGNSGFLRDLQMVVDCRNGSAPNITWGAIFRPRTDAETDFKCEAGKRNVYWISEYSEGEFVVAGWQETTGGNAE
jgi:hypothetical protein